MKSKLSKIFTPKNNQDGYSLIELIVAIQLMVIVITLIYMVFNYSQKFSIQWIRDIGGKQHELVAKNYLETEMLRAKEVSSTNGNTLLYLNSDYLMTKLTFSGDSVIFENVDSKKVIKDFNIKKMKYGKYQDFEKLVFMIEADSICVFNIKKSPIIN